MSSRCRSPAVTTVKRPSEGVAEAEKTRFGPSERILRTSTRTNSPVVSVPSATMVISTAWSRENTLRMTRTAPATFEGTGSSSPSERVCMSAIAVGINPPPTASANWQRPQAPSAMPRSNGTRRAVVQPPTRSPIEPRIPTLLAMLLAVPIGRIASGIPRCAIIRAARATVPSPPAATTISVNSSNNRFASCSFSTTQTRSWPCRSMAPRIWSSGTPSPALLL